MGAVYHCQNATLNSGITHSIAVTFEIKVALRTLEMYENYPGLSVFFQTSNYY